MAINSVSNFSAQLNSATSIVKSAVSLAKDLQGGNLAGAIKDIGGMFQGMANLAGGTAGSNASKGAPMSNAASEVAKLFGQGDPFEADNKKKQEAAKAAAAGGASGAPMSLGALLALVGGILVKSIESTMKGLADAAKQLDSASSGGGPTAALNQKIQELTFNLQQIQQTLNRVNETVTSLSKSQSDAQSTTARNLQV